MFESHLKDLLSEQNRSPAYYVGGTLCIDACGPYGLVMFNMNGTARAGLDGDPFMLTQEEYKLVAKVYLKNKTTKHSFYQKAHELVYGKSVCNIPDKEEIKRKHYGSPSQMAMEEMQDEEWMNEK